MRVDDQVHGYIGLAASTQGCSLHHPGLQPLAPMVAASTSRGCRARARLEVSPEAHLANECGDEQAELPPLVVEGEVVERVVQLARHVHEVVEQQRVGVVSW